MTRQTLSRWALLVGALVLTMVLAGCGGDDGVSPSTHQEALDRAAAEEAARLAAEEAARLAAEEAAAEEAARLAAEEAARIAAEEAAAEEAARLAAEEAARLAAEEAAREAAAAAEAERQRQEAEAARLAAEEAAREKAAEEAAAAARTAAINEAEMALATAQGVLMGLADDATYEAKRDAHRGIEAAATALRNVLAMNGGTDAQQDEAFATALEAGRQATALQQMINDAATAMTEAQTEAINTAQTGLDDAAAALAELAEDASDEAMRDAQRAVQHAADALVTALTENEGTAEQIAAAEAQRDSAKTTADGLDTMITEAAEAAAAAQMLADQRQAIADAIAAAQMAVSAVSNASTDEEIAAAGVEIAKVTTAIAAASDVPASEKTANSATVSALTAQLESAKASRMAAMEAAAQAQRMANIEAAEMVLETAQAALMALGDDATDEQKLAAQAAIADAATELRNVLAMNGGTDAQRDAAFEIALEARNAAATLRATIAARAAAAEAARMAAINTAQTALTEAEAALMALADDATDEAKRDAHRAIQQAAAALITALMNNEGTAEQIAAATAKRDSAMTMADNLQAMITEAADAAAAAQMLADQRQAVADAIAAASTAIAAVMDDSSDEVVSAADAAIAAATAAIAAATDLPATETAANTGTVTVLMSRLATAKASRMAAMDAAVEAERMAHIDAARQALTKQETALMALGDDATDEAMRDAYRMVEAAATALRDALRMYGGSSADIDAATLKAQTAKIAADNLTVKITAAANAAEERRMMAINDAETALSGAEDALTALGDDATDEAKRDALRAVEMAAANLVQVLTEHGGTAEQIADVTAMQEDAKMAADELHAAITAAQEEADQRQMVVDQRNAITTAIQTAMDAVGMVDNDASDAQVMAADTAIAAARTAIAAADALSDAEKAAHTSAVNAHATVLAAAKNSRQMAMTAAAEMQRMENINTAKAVLDAAKMALMDLDEDASDEDKLVAQRQIENAANAYRDVLRENGGTTEQVNYAIEASVRARIAADALDAEITRKANALAEARENAINGAQDMVDDAQDMVDALTDASTAQEKHDAYVALRDAYANLKMVLMDNDGSQDAIDAAESSREMAAEHVDPALEQVETSQQMMAITDAIKAAQDAVAKVKDDSEESVVTAAEEAIEDLEDAIDDATRLSDAVKNAHRGTATALEGQLAARKTSRTTAMAAADKTMNEANAADAAKLYAGISEPTGDVTSPAADDRAAAYNDAGTAILVSAVLTGETAPATAVTLSEDKKTMVPANHGWRGKRYADPAGGEMYEAMVYSNIEASTPGKKFGHAGAANNEFEYSLTDGALTITTATDTDNQERVASSMFDQSAGVKSFKKPANSVAVMITGMYHGVSGTYSCTPTGDTICASQVAADGFLLGSVASAVDSTFTASDTIWTFKPTDPNARVMSSPDADYESYGWWIRKSANGQTFTASVFTDDVGTVAAAVGLNALNGTATYTGGAAGKYALSSNTGGTNDAGHFTARATLEADFTNNTDAAAITGTIDQFVGADGKSRPSWSVELNGSPIADTGGIGDSTDGTVWTIDGNKAAADGNWTGSLRNNGDDGVPKVGTGTFYSTYGTSGKMIGAFGVTKQ